MPSAVVMLFTLIPTVLFIILFLSFRGHEKSKASKKLPPGNPWILPLIGETLHFCKPHPSSSIGEFMEHQMAKFGRIFSSHLMGSRTIVSTDAELNRFVLRSEMRLFGPGWPPGMKVLLGKDSIPLLAGDPHKDLRSLLVNFLNGENRRKVFLEDANELALLRISSWDKKPVIYATDEAAKFTLSVIVKNALSRSPGDPVNEKLRQEYDIFKRGLTSFPIHLPGTSFWKASKSRKNIVKITEQEIKERMEMKRFGSLDEGDFLEYLMKNTNYSPEKIATVILGMIFAGQETTASSIASLVCFLGGCPKAVQQLREEHLQVVRSKEQKGETKLTWEDYKAMEFTKCVINETLRLSSIADFLMKKATKDVEFKGYVIPQGHNILVHISSMHLDPDVYENPTHFNPWRWQCPSGVMTTSLMPFGGGVRLCPGAELARMEISVFLHHLILNYDWEFAEPDQPMKLPFNAFAKGLPIIVRAISTF